MHRFFSTSELSAPAARLISVAALVLTGLLVPAPKAAADPFCPNNGPAFIDPKFAPLVERLGTAVVGNATTCATNESGGGLDQLEQETTTGYLWEFNGVLEFHPWKPTSTINNGVWRLDPGGQLVGPPLNPVSPPAPAPDQPGPDPIAPGPGLPPAPAPDEPGPNPLPAQPNPPLPDPQPAPGPQPPAIPVQSAPGLPDPVSTIPSPYVSPNRCAAPPVPVRASAGSRSADPRFGIAEGFRNPTEMASIGAGWERVIIPWDQIQPAQAGDFSKMGTTFTRQQLQRELDRGTHVAGLLQFTPEWAAANLADGKRSVPKNLYLAYDDPNNYFGQYAYQTAKYYAGQIDEWIVWNEPEFKPGDAGAGGSYTWLGSDEDFAQLMKVAYLAIKKANPNAVVSFPGTSYWVDFNSNRPAYYDRIMAIVSRDPEAASHNDYHDAVSLNIYRAPDDIFRVHQVYDGIEAKYGMCKPLWLTELNAMPSDDGGIPCASQFSGTDIQTTMDEQAAYAIQSLALGAAAGYGKVEFYQMVDSNPCTQPAVWGLTRDDGSPRPVADAIQTAVQNLSDFQRAQFVPLTREDAAWAAWPADPDSLVPNWQIYQVAFDKPDNQRVTVLWNGDAADHDVEIPKKGARAMLIDRRGNSQPLQEDQGSWVVTLPGATAHYQEDPNGYHFIGGDPVLVAESGVDPATPVVAPRVKSTKPGLGCGDKNHVHTGAPGNPDASCKTADS